MDLWELVISGVVMVFLVMAVLQLALGAVSLVIRSVEARQKVPAPQGKPVERGQ